MTRAFFLEVNSGKNPSHPQKFACSYTYDVAHIATAISVRCDKSIASVA